MAEADRILAVIPARGGSKRLPRKNVLPLGGRPLITWSLDAARESGACVELLVSTDDQEIADVARAAGALVPWLRPAELATDTAGSAEVIAHALAWYEAEHGPVDAVLLLQPTSPFRTAQAIRGAVAAYREQPAAERHPVVSVSPTDTPPAWTFTLGGGTMQPVLGWEPLQRRSQDLPPTYALNGSLYLIPAEAARRADPILRPGVRPYVMTDAGARIDIDTVADWQQAEAFAAAIPAGDGPLR